jgi:Flp pilus assembly protein TadD
MPVDRVAALERMLERRPDDPRLRFGLALECFAAGRDEEGVRHLRAYLEAADDEGNAWGRLGSALRRSGEDEEAKEAYGRGIEAAYRHGHPTMAAEFESVLEEWDA